MAMFPFAKIENDYDFSFSNLRMHPFESIFGKRIYMISNNLNIFFGKSYNSSYGGNIDISLDGIENDDTKYYYGSEYEKYGLDSCFFYISESKLVLNPIFLTYAEAEYARKLIISKNFEYYKSEYNKKKKRFDRANDGKIIFDLDSCTSGDFKVKASVNYTGSNDANKIPPEVLIFFQETLSKKLYEEMEKVKKLYDFYLALKEKYLS